MKKLSVVISAYNEEKNIELCLKSVAWADEIIVIDNSSTDETVKITKKYTSKIYERKNNKMLNVNKNFGFSKATGDWILSLDADERISDELAKEIKGILSQELDIAGYWIPRKNIIFGKWIENEMWWPDYQLRLFRNGKGKFPEKHVHEYIEVNGATEKLQNSMIHENYTSISQYLYKMEHIYTENEVENKLRQKVTVSWVDALRYPMQDFLKIFFLQKGYRDGLHGLALALLQAFYMEIVFLKLWEKQGFTPYTSKNFLWDVHGEFKKIKSEFIYWFLQSFQEESKGPFKKITYKIIQKVKNKVVNIF